MSELTTVARPYAKAAFDFAVEAKAIDSWLSQLTFAAEVAQDNTIIGYISGGASVEQAQTLFLNVCGEQVDSQGQNFLKVMAKKRTFVGATTSS
jgi:F-type H+-transporting ATPase subunit delta